MQTLDIISHLKFYCCVDSCRICCNSVQIIYWVLNFSLMILRCVMKLDFQMWLLCVDRYLQLVVAAVSILQ